MNCKLNKLTILSLTLLSITFIACDKNSSPNTAPEVKTAEFSVKKSKYLTKDVYFVAKDSIGGNEYSWDFGDGITLTGKYNVTHKYNKGGLFLTSLTINGIKSSQGIEVNNGTLSFRIVNKSSKYFDCLTYIDNYETGSVNRFWVNMQSQSDTIYGYNLNNWGNLHLFGISLFILNSEYTLPNSEYTLSNITWLKDFEHHDITITDSTTVVPRSSHGISNSVLIKDL